jgi:hypothetical protein
VTERRVITIPAPSRGVLVAAAVLAAGAVLQTLGRGAGSTQFERYAELPGDAVVPRPQLVTDHAVSIHAAPERVWPWLTQLGWHLGGWYTPRWVDRLLFPGNWPSLDALDPALARDLHAGDRIPDGPPGTAEYVVAQVEVPTLLVLRSTTHVPPGWAAHGAAVDWTWTFRLTPHEEGRSTRLHLRVRGRTSPWWFTAAYRLTVLPADLVMATGMLRGLRRRVESGAPPAASGRAPYR